MSRAMVGLAVLLISTAAGAETPAELEQRFRADVARVSADAAIAYDRGNAARAAGRLDDAIAAYRAAIALAPNVDHPHRRLCSVLEHAHHVDDAVAECEAALALAPQSPYDQTNLAGVLRDRARTGDLDRALQLSRDANDTLPDDVTAVETRCLVLLKVHHEGQFIECTKHLLVIAPDDPVGNYFGAMIAADGRDYDGARVYVGKAKAAGFDAAAIAALERAIDHNEEVTATFPAWARTAGRVGVWVIAIWLMMIVMLLVAGVTLSRLTLRTVNRATATAGDAIGTPRERRMRAIYKAVLLLAGACFYVAMPILLVTIVAAGGVAIAALCDLSGGIPIFWVSVVVIAVVATVAAILRSVFTRAPVVAPGEPLALAQHPALRALLDDVARTSDTRPVDVAYLVPGTMMAVSERGGLWASLRGKHGERSVILGVALFDGMKQLELRSILAHEYGHFRNRDTAGGGFAIAVRRSLVVLLEQLATGRTLAVVNPVWWFLRAYFRAYFAISQGASRLQEVLADRWAIQAYGSAAFIAGFRYTVEREVEFEHDLGPTIAEVLAQRLALPNLYAYEPPGGDASEAALETKLAAAMTREPTAYDSHPSTRQRLAWAEQLAVAHAAQPDDDAPVWALFADRDAIERAMTTVIRARLQTKLRVTIPAEAPVVPIGT